MKFNQVAIQLAPTTSQKELARAIEVDPRTLRNWRGRQRPEDFPKMGRPAHDERAHRAAFWKVGREYLRQGRCGWRPIAGALAGQVPTRLVQAALRKIKALEGAHQRRRISCRQVRVDVLAKNAIWVHDSAQVGRSLAGAKIESQVVKDRGPLVTVGISTGDPAACDDVVELLELLKATRGLPLVWATDNGSPFAGSTTQAFLTRERVIHLRSLPRTPQHNGSAEVGIGELKRCAKLRAGKTVLRSQAHARIVRASQILNGNRLRSKNGLKTGAELDDRCSEAIRHVDRETFYRECSKRTAELQLGSSGWRAGRMAEREAIYETMERYGLIRRYRGGSQAVAKAEIFS